MARFASHYIYLSPDRVLKMHFIELDEKGCFVSCKPLTEEMEAVAFYNGILFMVRKEEEIQPHQLLQRLQELQRAFPGYSAFRILEESRCATADTNCPVAIFHLDGIDLFSPEFCTDDGGSQGYIERL